MPLNVLQPARHLALQVYHRFMYMSGLSRVVGLVSSQKPLGLAQGASFLVVLSDCDLLCKAKDCRMCFYLHVSNS